MDCEANDQARTKLSSVLVRLDRVFPAEVSETLRLPVTCEDLSALTATLAGSEKLPNDLLELLSWHDGQSWNAPLSRKNNRRLLSASEIKQERLFFADPMSEFMEPWRPSWLPVLTNDSGDFLVYETGGELEGALLHYWHDDSSRNVAYPSLLHWAEELLREYEQPDA